VAVPAGPVGGPVVVELDVVTVVFVVEVAVLWRSNAAGAPLTAADTTSLGPTVVASLTMPVASSVNCSTVVFSIETVAVDPFAGLT
jgi:hypothetical protein